MTDIEQRTYHGTAAPYMLPNDPTDHERLNLQNEGMTEMMYNVVNQAPLHNPQRILDVGCGTGIQTRYFARAYPSATNVIGLDLSAVPEEPHTPSQVSFLQGDIHELATDPDHPQISSGSFDYVFNRLLVYGMTDWPGYIAKAKKLLSPGGWLEIQELQFSYINKDGEELSLAWPWMQEQTKAWANRGLDMQCGPKLEGYVRDAGFVDVQVKKFRWAWGSWPGHPESEKLRNVNVKYNRYANAAAMRKIFGAAKDPEELERMIEKMLKDLDGSDEQGHFPFWVVYGRKP